jgi:carbamoyltransferase
MITWGVNALNHDASIAVFDNAKLKYWKRSSELSGIPNDDKLCRELILESFSYANQRGPDTIVWYERPWLKKTRQFYAGQYNWAFDVNELPNRYLKSLNLSYSKIKYIPHHLSHASAGFLTSPFDEATVIVLDALGEWESSTIWRGKGTNLSKVWSRSYPTSLGLFYSAFTDLIGLTPIKEEHILQRYSDLGDKNRYLDKIRKYWNFDWTLRINLHKGVVDWTDKIVCDQDRYDIAAAVQEVFEEQVMKAIDWAHILAPSKNLVYMGGCAMNSKFNKKLENLYDGIWSLPIPGDSASSIGAALYYQQARIEWDRGIAKHIPIKYNNTI